MKFFQLGGTSVSTKMAFTGHSGSHAPQSMQHDPQFAARFSWIPKERLGADQLPFPVLIEGQEPHVPSKAPTVGEHTDAVLADVLGLDAAAIAALRERGALG